MKITFEHVTKRFGQILALDDIDFEIPSGELFFLLGPSGCGKTTLLRAVAGLTEIDAGRILFGDRDVSAVPTHKRGTAMVFQGYALWPHMTVAQNVAFGLELRLDSRQERDARVEKALAQVQIAELAARKPHELSGGQQQRVALARTLAVEPHCLLLDEPLANLDAKLRRDMRAGIRKVCKEAGLTAIYVTHDRQEALSMADRVAVLSAGRVLQVGPPREIYTRPINTFVAGFIGESNFVPANMLECRNGQARVESALGILRSTAVPDDCVTGQALTLSLRPETLSIGPAAVENPEDNILSATIVESTYLGEIAEHLMTAGAQVMLKVFELNPRQARKTGDTVALRVAPADAVVLPAATTA